MVFRQRVLFSVKVYGWGCGLGLGLGLRFTD
jgi:hypothetical protein